MPSYLVYVTGLTTEHPPDPILTLIHQIQSVFRAIGSCLMSIVNAIGAVLHAIINGVVTVFDVIISFLTCGYCSRRKRRTRLAV